MFVRICVDVDEQGNGCGWSAERHSDDGVDRIVAGSHLGPFDSLDEWFQHAVRTTLDRWGRPMRLFD